MRLICAISRRTSLTTARAGLVAGQIAANNFDHAGNACEWIADLMGERGGEFSNHGQVFRPSQLVAMQPFDLVAPFAQVLDHVVEATTEVSDCVAEIGEAYNNI
jgi:hypothetical protein